MTDDGKKHAINQTMQDIVGSLGVDSFGSPSCNYQLTDYVEWVVVHKGCGKPLTGSSPKNGWCYCDSTGTPPMAKEQPAIQSVDVSLIERCNTAEKEVLKLREKLDKASKRIAELTKKDL